MRKNHIPVLVVCCVLLLALSAFAANVFYSVGTNSGDLKSGAPTITISSGTATLTVAQPNNIGVGDRISYDSPAQRCYIIGRTSSTEFTVRTKIGGVPANVSGKTVNSIKRLFNSLNAALTYADDSLGTTNLTSGNYILNLACYGDGADNAIATVSGWTTSSSNYIRIFTPKASNEVGVSQRHDGKYSTSAYRLEITDGPSSDALIVNQSNIKIEGLQVYRNNSSGTRYCININQSVSGVDIDKCILRGGGTGYTSFGILLGYHLTISATIRNSIIYGCPSAGMGIYHNYATSLDVKFFNCTISGCGIGIAGPGDANPTGGYTIKNCAVFNNGDDFAMQGCGTSTIDYCASDDGDGTHSVNISPGSSETSDWGNAFTDYANGDFHIKNASSVLNGAGTDLSSQGFSDDIDGETRTVPWSIGADEGVAPQWVTAGDNIYNGNSGNVGIGTTSPQARLDVDGNIKSSGQISAFEDVTISGHDGVAFLHATGMGMNNQATSLRIMTPDAPGNGSVGGDIILDPGDAPGDGGGPGAVRVYGPLNCAANVTTSGVVQAATFKVGDWTLSTPDFVFDKDYKLMSLKEVDQYIAEHKHLPGVASADEMKKDGVDLAKMNMDLLKKVEELTLYVIEQKKEIEKLKRQ